MKLFALVAAYFFAAVLAADAKQDQDVFKIKAILENLNRGAQELNEKIINWRIGNSQDFTSLLSTSQLLRTAILDANSTISGYSGLVETDTLRLEPPVNALSHTVGHIIDNLERRKPEVYAYKTGSALASVIEGEIVLDRDAAGNTSATIVSKVPKDLQPVARTLADQIVDNLIRGVEIYACENCTSTSGAVSIGSMGSSHLFALAAVLVVAFTL